MVAKSLLRALYLLHLALGVQDAVDHLGVVLLDALLPELLEAEVLVDHPLRRVDLRRVQLLLLEQTRTAGQVLLPLAQAGHLRCLGCTGDFSGLLRYACLLREWRRLVCTQGDMLRLLRSW